MFDRRLSNCSSDWFHQLTGFREGGYEETRANLIVEGTMLRSLVNGKSYAIGDLELVSLKTLRERAASAGKRRGRLRVSVVSGDVGEMHGLPENAGAVFQVASQFNLLEMTDPTVTPEDGVTRYAQDHTQGPACAMAAGAATIYRNYFVPLGGGLGQTKDRQLDGLADLGQWLSTAIDRPIGAMWRMRNGYALCITEGLSAIAAHLRRSGPERLNDVRDRLRIGVHREVEVTNVAGASRPLVTQAFCSALPVAYCSAPPAQWVPFASLVLEAAYEATLWSAVLNAHRGASNVVLLTLLGGGAFGNEPHWIYDAMRRSLEMMAGFDLDVKIVSFGPPPLELLEVVRRATGG